MAGAAEDGFGGGEIGTVGLGGAGPSLGHHGGCLFSLYSGGILTNINDVLNRVQ